MTKFICLIVLILISCESNPSSNKNEVKTDAYLISIEKNVNLYDLERPALSNLIFESGNRLFISTGKYYDQSNIEINKAYVDADQYVGQPDYYVDFGQIVRLEDILLDRERMVRENDVDYNFRYSFDSERSSSEFSNLFEFSQPLRFTNKNDFNEGSSKRIFGFETMIYAPKRLHFQNVSANQIMAKDEDLYIEFNRDLYPYNSTFGFVYEDIENAPVFASFTVSESTNRMTIPMNIVQNFVNRVGKNEFTCKIWVVETKTLSQNINTRLKSTYLENNTPIVVNTIEVIEIKFL